VLRIPYPSGDRFSAALPATFAKPLHGGGRRSGAVPRL